MCQFNPRPRLVPGFVCLLFGAWLCAPPPAAYAHLNRRARDAQQQQPGAAAADTRPSELKLGTAVETELAGGAAHSYQLTLTTGQFVQVMLDQRGIDVVVRLYAPDGTEVARSASPNGAQGLEQVLHVAATTGTYRLAVQPAKADAPAGHYEVKLARLRAATPQDRDFAAGEALFVAGEQLRVQKTPEALRSALQQYEAAQPLLHAADERHREAETLTNMAVVAALLGEKQKALGYYSRVFPLTQGDGEVFNVQSMIDLYYTFDKAEKRQAIGYMENVRGLLHLTGNRYMETYMLIGIGFASVDLGETQKALAYFNQALPLARQTGNRDGEAYVLTHIGGLYASQGDAQKALTYFNQALPLFRAVKDAVGERYALGGLIALYRYLGDTQQQLTYLDRELALANTLDSGSNGSMKANALMHIGEVYLDTHELPKAFDYLNQALQVAKQHGGGPRSYEAFVLDDLGDAYRAARQLAQAQTYYTQALALFRARGDRRYEAGTLTALGLTYDAQGEPQQAVAQLNQSLGIQREVQSRTGEAHTLAGLMSAWSDLRQPRLAIFYGKQAVNIHQETRTKIQGLGQEVAKSFIKARERTYRQLAELLIGEGRLPEAQQVLKLLKEEEYFDYIRRDAGESDALGGSAALTPTEAEWEERYRQVADNVAAIGSERSELLAKKLRSRVEEERLTHLDADLRAAGHAFQKFLDELAVEFGNTKRAARLNELRESQALMEDLRELGAGAVMLYTVLGEDKYRVILVTPDIQKAQEYPIKDTELARKVAAFREVLQDSRRDAKPLAQELYQILVAPIAQDLAQAHATTLMWSLDGVLRYVPMAALYDGTQYLVERYRTVVFTPASTARLKDMPSPQWRGLGFGVSQAHDRFKPLPAVPDELRGIIRDEASGSTPPTATPGVLPGRVMLDEAFTETTMTDALRERYPVVHIASHFSFQPGSEQQSFLLLGNGHHLSLADIKTSVNLFGGVELLTLSACDTATGGGEAEGKEVEGFAVLAQRQGAKAVVASLWPVADASTRALMQQFYRAREAQPGTPKVEALRQAQLSLLYGNVQGEATRRRGMRDDIEPNADKKIYTHPYYWAPFIMIGNWR